MPKVVTRSGWDARAPRSVTTVPTPHRQAWIHHTAGSETGPAGMRAIQRFHMDTRRWNDIGYSWVYDPKTRTWFEGRGFGIKGAHTPGHNDDLGLAVMGNFDHIRPDAVTVTDVRWMLKHAADRNRLATAELAGGHRDVKATACPGRHLYAAIGDINAQEDDMPLTDDDVARIAKAVATRPVPYTSVTAEVAWSQTVRTAQIIRAGVADLQGRQGDVDVDSLAEAIAAELDDDLASAVLDALRDRLAD